jgi:hypothetical protein
MTEEVPNLPDWELVDFPAVALHSCYAEKIGKQPTLNN